MDLELLYPRYVIAQIATNKAFFEIVDTHAPFMKGFELPDAEDYKKDKFTISLTVFAEKEGEKARQLRHFVDKKELLLLMDQMSRGVKGVSRGEEKYDPILTSMKGSPDRNYPDWEFTSRTLRVTYSNLRIGPGYAIEFTAQEGRKIGTGIIAPTGNTKGLDKAMIALPILPTEKGMPPLALQVAHQVLNYLQAREVTRQQLWMNSVSRLRQDAENGSAGAIQRWNDYAHNYATKGE